MYEFVHSHACAEKIRKFDYFPISLFLIIWSIQSKNIWLIDLMTDQWSDGSIDSLIDFLQ